MNESYTAHVLDNGLTVLLQENHSAPVISHGIWYRVGSRTEIPGKTGISHFVEHMQFKGTERYPGKEMVWDVSRNGGILNGSTSQDYTAFYETMPAEHIGIALDIEADRMMNSLFDPKEVEAERTVILSEKEGDESNPSYDLYKSMQKAAFPHHPYRWDVIGETEDLQRMRRDDLYEYYRTWYSPNNAMVTVVGDFDTEEMLRRVEDAYGNIPAHHLPVTNVVPAGPIRSMLKIEDQGPGDLTDMRIDWLVPGAKDPDIPALTLLVSILAGPDSMTMFDNVRITGRTSRLYRSLVTRRKLADIHGRFNLTIDPYVFSLYTLVHPGITADEAGEAIFKEIESLARDGVRPAEIKQARKQMKALFAYTAEDTAMQAQWLGLSSMTADPEWHIGYRQRLENVSEEDVSRIAGTLFRRDNCVIGVYNPEEE